MDFGLEIAGSLSLREGLPLPRYPRRVVANHRSLPYVHVPDAAAAFSKALAAGVEEMMPPTRVIEGVTIAIVRAPGGVPIGLSGP